MAKPYSEWQDSQAQPWVTINEALRILWEGSHHLLSKAVSGDVELTQAETYEHGVIRLTGTPGSGFDVFLDPEDQKTFAVINDADATATVAVSDGADPPGAAGTTQTVAAGATAVLHHDGTDVRTLVAGGETFLALTDTPANYTGQAGQQPTVKSDESGLEYKRRAYDVPLFSGDAPDDGSVIAGFVAPQALTIPSSPSEGAHQAHAGTALDTGEADYVISLQKNGTEVGTVTFSADTNTGTVSISSDVALAAGDHFDAVHPNGTRTLTLANIKVMLVGNLT